MKNWNTLWKESVFCFMNFMLFTIHIILLIYSKKIKVLRIILVVLAVHSSGQWFLILFLKLLLFKFKWSHHCEESSFFYIFSSSFLRWFFFVFSYLSLLIFLSLDMAISITSVDFWFLSFIPIFGWFQYLFVYLFG